jgi:hypothetical protein
MLHCVNNPRTFIERMIRGGFRMKKSSLAIIAIAGVAICQTGNAYSTRIYNRGTIIVAANNGSPGGAQLPTASDVLSRQKLSRNGHSNKASSRQALTILIHQAINLVPA